MAKGRFISRSISTNEQLASVSFNADYFFTRCIAHLDVDGRLTGNPVLLKSNVVPLRDEITLKLIPKLIEELGAAVDLAGRSLVVWYEVGAQRVLFFPGFAGQQTGLRVKRESPSRLPPLSGSVRVLAGTVSGVTPEPRRITSGSTPDESRSDAGVSPPQGEVKVEVEVEVEVQAEGKGEDGRPIEHVAGVAPLFARLDPGLDPAPIETFLRRVPLDQRVESWVAEVDGWLDGLNLQRAPTHAQVATALREFNRFVPPRYDMPYVRGFVARAIRGESNRRASERAPELATTAPASKYGALLGGE